MVKDIVTMSRGDYDNMVDKCRILDTEISAILSGEKGFFLTVYSDYNNNKGDCLKIVKDRVFEQEIKNLYETRDEYLVTKHKIEKIESELNLEKEKHRDTLRHLSEAKKEISDKLKFYESELKNTMLDISKKNMEISDLKNLIITSSFISRIRYLFTGILN